MKTNEEQKSLNPEQLHKRQTMLHVLVPVITTGIVCLAVCTLLIVSTSAEPHSTEQWAQISTMFLILPAILLGLVCLALLILLATQGNKWNKNWPPALRNVRLTIIHIEKNIQGFAQKPAQPVIAIKSVWAGIMAIFKK
jgi:hypothetical protein